MQLRMKILNLNGPDDELQINQNWIRKIDEAEEDGDETIAILTEHQGPNTRLKNNIEQLYLTENIIYVANEINWYAK